MRRGKAIVGLSIGAAAVTCQAAANINTSPANALLSREPPAYANIVCRPPTRSATDPVPPCTEVETIEIMCEPNGTEAIYMAAHSQCLCGGSFFAEWNGCQQCLFVHGLRTEQEMAFYSGVISNVSTSLCKSTPTAVFRSIFAEVQSAATLVTTGATTLSDRAVSQTAVSIYYTASGRQGPGQITGDAAKATAATLMTAAPPSKSASLSGSSSGQALTSASAPGGAASTPSSGVRKAVDLSVGVIIAGLLALNLL
jgi:hypothetical protein